MTSQSTLRTLEKIASPPFSVRKQIFGLDGCSTATGVSLRNALEAWEKEPVPGAFNPRLALHLIDFARYAYKSRVETPPDLPSVALRAPYPKSSCTSFRLLSDGFISREGAQCFVASNDLQDLVVAFRGTEPPTELDGDWRRNFNFSFKRYKKDGLPPSRLHRGFFNGYRHLRGSIERLLKQHATPTTSLYLTGHSQGGALATIAALDLSIRMKGDALPEMPVSLYAFGAPRCMNRPCTRLFAKHVRNGYVVVNSRDFVARIPPALRRPAKIENRYAHIPNLIRLTESSEGLKVEEISGDSYRPHPLDGATVRHHKTSRYRRLLESLVEA